MNKRILLFTAAMILSGNTIFAAAAAEPNQAILDANSWVSLKEAVAYFTLFAKKSTAILEAIDQYKKDKNIGNLARALDQILSTEEYVKYLGRAPREKDNTLHRTKYFFEIMHSDAIAWNYSIAPADEFDLPPAIDLITTALDKAKQVIENLSEILDEKTPPDVTPHASDIEDANLQKAIEESLEEAKLQEAIQMSLEKP